MMHCIVYLAVALLLSACAPTPQAGHSPVADASPPCPAGRALGTGWQRLEEPGVYTVCLPREMELDTSRVGIDTRTMTYRSPSLEVFFMYGVDRAGVSVNAPPPGERREMVTVDGHPATLRHTRAPEGKAEWPFSLGLDVRLPPPQRPPGHPLTGLGYQVNVSAKYKTAAGCAVARQIFESIRFQK